MLVPLHLKPEDYHTREGATKLMRLWDAAISANPRGFRTPSRKKGHICSLSQRLAGYRTVERYGAA